MAVAERLSRGLQIVDPLRQRVAGEIDAVLLEPSRAFATGFLFFVVTITLSIPGALVLGWENLRGSSRRGPASGTPQPTTRPQS